VAAVEPVRSRKRQDPGPSSGTGIFVSPEARMPIASGQMMCSQSFPGVLVQCGMCGLEAHRCRTPSTPVNRVSYPRSEEEAHRDALHILLGREGKPGTVRARNSHTACQCIRRHARGIAGVSAGREILRPLPFMRMPKTSSRILNPRQSGGYTRNRLLQTAGCSMHTASRRASSSPSPPAG
jgi:hypothetical protein